MIYNMVSFHVESARDLSSDLSHMFKSQCIALKPVPNAGFLLPWPVGMSGRECINLIKSFRKLLEIHD